MKKKILIGNSFPFSLVRNARMVAEPQPLAALMGALADADVVSFWGHANTLAAAEEELGRSLKPRTERPAITLSPEGLPMLGGCEFDTCWLLSPDYQEGFRPPAGAEVVPEQIAGWQVLKLTWNKSRKEI